MLSKEENPSANLNKTSYRDQINKVANGIKEILSALKKSPVETLRHEQKTSVGKTRKFPGIKKIVAGLITLLLIGAIVFSVAQFRSAAMDEPEIVKSIAVLPFDDMSHGKDQEYLRDGIAEEVITALSRIKDLKVIGRTSSFQFKGDKVDLRDIGEKLDVATVLEGSIQKSGNNVRVTAQLIRVSDGSHIWSERYDRSITDIFAIQDEISSHIAEKLKLTLFKTDGGSSENHPTKNMEAYEMWLKGNHFLRQGPIAHEKAIVFFQKAIDLDSTYADAYIGMGWGYLFAFENNSEWLERVKSTVNKAIIHHVNEDRASELMLEVYLYEWNWSEAKKEYDKWFASNSDGTVSHALYLGTAYGDFRSATDMLKAIVRKDPLNLEALRMLGATLNYDRRYDEARRVNRNILEIDPAYGSAFLSIGWSYFLEGNYELAYENYAVAQTLLPTNSRSLATRRIITLAYDNRKSEAMKEFEKFKELNKDYSTYNAEVLFALGHVDEAFRHLEIAYDKREPLLVHLRIYPIFNPYRSDKRFQALMQKMNFPEK